MKFSKMGVKIFKSLCNYFFFKFNREAEEYFQRRSRPASSSAIPRKPSEDILRNSTPNLASKFKRCPKIYRLSQTLSFSLV